MKKNIQTSVTKLQEAIFELEAQGVSLIGVTNGRTWEANLIRNANKTSSKAEAIALQSKATALGAKKDAARNKMNEYKAKVAKLEENIKMMQMGLGRVSQDEQMIYKGQIAENQKQLLKDQKNLDKYTKALEELN
jgi:chromosome segregation ATPase